MCVACARLFLSHELRNTKKMATDIKTPPSVKKVQKTLILLANAKPSAAKKIIKNASHNVLKAVSEICLNMLNGVVNLSVSHKKKLKKYRNTMRKLAEKNTSLTARRKLMQRGGFIGSVLGIGLPLLVKGISALVSHIRNKKAKKSRRQ